MDEKPDDMILVCDACKTEACIKGEVYCEDYKEAGTMYVPSKSLIKTRKNWGVW